MGAICSSFPLTSELLANMDSSTSFHRFGIIADLHGGLANDADSRLDTILQNFKAEKLDGLIQLGDFAFPNRKHQNFADKFNAAHDNTIHVIGNHEFDFDLARTDCYEAWGIENSYYRSDINDFRIIVLDGNEKGSPEHQGGYPSYIGKEQQVWLEQELKSTDRPVLILSHQPLAGTSAIDNANEIQSLLSRYKDKILLCLNGHSHVDLLLQVHGVNYLHINSASYYWVGGEKRMAYYDSPLYSILTFDSVNATIDIKGCFSDWQTGDNPAQHNYFKRDNAPPETIVVPTIRHRKLDKHQIQTLGKPPVDSNKSIPLKVMTWNIWGRLNQDPRYTINNKTARERTIEILKNSDADVIAMIETYGSAEDIATALNFHHHTPAEDANLCIFSRHPLSEVELLQGLSPFSFLAATVTLPNNKKIRIYDIWLTSGGRHIVEIKNKELSDQDFCNGDDLRFDMLDLLLQHEDVRKAIEKSNEIPIIAAGDFNCVSHLDHTVGTRHSELNHSRVLPNKVSKAMHQAGFVDTYRMANPDILPTTLGHTWTTVGMGYLYKSGEGFIPVKENPEPQYRDPYTRIDYIYSMGSSLQIKSSKVITHHPSENERSFPEFPSDHAAVLTEFIVN